MEMMGEAEHALESHDAASSSKKRGCGPSSGLNSADLDDVLPDDILYAIGKQLFSIYDKPNLPVVEKLEAAQWAGQLARVGGRAFDYLAVSLFDTAVDPGCKAARDTANPALVSRTRCPVRPRARRMIARLVAARYESLFESRITGSEARERYGLNSAQLNSITPDVVKTNPYGADRPPMRLFNRTAIVRLANECQPELDDQFWDAATIQQETAKALAQRTAVDARLRGLGLTREEARRGCVEASELRTLDSGIDGEQMNQVLVQAKARLTRLRQLQTALLARGLALRSVGSGCCYLFLTHGDGTLADTVSAVEADAQEHQFYLEHTEYSAMWAALQQEDACQRAANIRAGPVLDVSTWVAEEEREDQSDYVKELAFAKWLQGFTSNTSAALQPMLPLSLKARALVEWWAPLALPAPPTAAPQPAPPAAAAAEPPPSPADFKLLASMQLLQTINSVLGGVGQPLHWQQALFHASIAVLLTARLTVQQVWGLAARLPSLPRPAALQMLTRLLQINPLPQPPAMLVPHLAATSTLALLLPALQPQTAQPAVAQVPQLAPGTLPQPAIALQTQPVPHQP